MSATQTPLRSTSKKRELTSPEDQSDIKKNRVFPESESESETDISDLSVLGSSLPAMMADTVTIDPSAVTDSASSQNAITLKEADLIIIGGILKNSFQPQISDMVNSIVNGVLDGLKSTIKDLEEENIKLKARVEQLEGRADAAEQYSRRNCLRVAGVPEDQDENTDDYVMKLTGDLGVDVALDDIERSHRVGRPRATGRPRDIIVKFASYRVRRRVYGVRIQTKVKGFMGVFINEDLTKPRIQLLRKARIMVKASLMKSSWSSDGTILVRDHADAVHRIISDSDLAKFGPVPKLEVRGAGAAQGEQSTSEPPIVTESGMIH